MSDEENWEISHSTPPRIMDATKMIRSLTDCGLQTAFRLAVEFDGDAVAAVDSLLVKPVTAGDKYIPAKPVVSSTLDPEQEERCKKGRWLQDKVNGVYSVAHSQTKTLQDQQAPEVAERQMPVSLPGAPGS